MGEMRNPYGILGGNVKRRGPLRDLKLYVNESWTFIHPAHDRGQWRGLLTTRINLQVP
jgi:hypothetical protein